MKTNTTTKKNNIFIEVCRYFGSLKLAIFLIVILAAILICSTLYESFESTELAQRFVYATWWFDLLLTLFALNVFCAVVLRWPFERRHTGFIITHLGLLFICLGSGMNRHLGIDGQMYLTEGDALDEMTLGERVVEVGLSNTDSYRLPADEFKLKDRIGKPLNLGDSEFYLTFLEWANGVNRKLKITDSGTPERNPAVVFEIKSEMAGFHEEQTLVYDDPSNPDSSTWALGPAKFRLLMALSDAEEKMLLKPPSLPEVKEDDVPYLVVEVPNVKMPIRVPVKPGKDESVDLPSINAKIQIVEYFPSARVVGNELVNEPDATPNPAVRFEVKHKDGRVEKHTAFALFPEFDTLHGSTGEGWSKIHARLESAHPAGKEQPKANFTFIQGMDEKLRFVSETAKGEFSSGEINLNEWQSAGWMDFQFLVTEYYPRASAKYEFEPLDVVKTAKKQEVQPVIRLKLDYLDSETGEKIAGEPEWLSFGEPKALSVGGRQANAVFRYKTASVPFSLKLVDFRRTFYPGTRSPAAYESDVVLHDHVSGVTIERKIYMNHPLDYAGYRIFQSSFIEVPPGQSEISVFQVAKAPGTPIIYLGAIVMIAGIVTMFYIKPFSSSVRDGT